VSPSQTPDLQDITDNIKELKIQIQSRKDFLHNIRECVVDVMGKIGKTTKSVVKNLNVHVVKEVEEFGIFSLYYSTTEARLEGNTIKVLYRNVVVLHFRFRSLSNPKYKVLIYPDLVMQNKIDGVIADKEALITYYLRAKEEEATGQLAQLQEEAGRLGLPQYVN